MTVSKLNNDIERRAAGERQRDDLEERARQAALEEYRSRAQRQWFEEGSCTGGPATNTNNKE
jgi:hypothetical protein